MAATTGLRALHDLGHGRADFLGAVLEGLSQPRKRLPSAFFYDARGSRLFDRICRLPEYYPTRTETAILRDAAADLAALVPAGAALVEFGSGSSTKTRILLDGLDRLACYVPIDISRDHLRAAARDVASDYPDLAVSPVCADYGRDFALPADLGGVRRVGFFPGSTIGNFSPPEAEAFLRRCLALLGPDAAMLVGVDLRKDPETLRAAYNDAAGVTAAFNLNLLARMQRELGAKLDIEAFGHRAVYNEARACVEMHIVSLAVQDIEIEGKKFSFHEGETIHSEDSHKYSVAGFQALAQAAGWRPSNLWRDPDALFSVHYLTAP